MTAILGTPRYEGDLRPVWTAASYAKRPERTIRTWLREGTVTSACDVTTRELLVSLGDVAERSARTARRRRRDTPHSSGSLTLASDH